MSSFDVEHVSDWILAHGADLQVALFFALLAILAVVERLWPRRPGSMERRSRWPANFALTGLNLATMSVIPISLITAASLAQSRRIGLLNNVALPIAALIALNLVLRGFISFATHYLMHKVPAFWRVHRVHHLDTELDVSSTVRFHPLEFVIALIPGIPMVLAFGLTPWILMVYELMDVVVTLWSHSNVRLPVALDRVLRYLVVTPDLHRVHHSSWQPETDSNFGAVLPIWDLVFGTFRTIPRDRHPTMELGLSEVRGRAANRLGWLLKSIGLSEIKRQAVILERATAPTRSPGAESSR